MMTRMPLDHQLPTPGQRAGCEGRESVVISRVQSGHERARVARENSAQGKASLWALY